MLRRAARISSAVLESGPRAVLITREAKKRGAAQKTREFAALVAVLARRDLKVILEIGSLHGGTLWAWSRLAACDALLVSVDLPGGEFGGGYDTQTARVIERYAGPGQKVVLIQGDSHLDSTRRRVEEVLNGRSVDLLFIDGDHSYAGVRKDFETYAPLVTEGSGLVAFHDILPHDDGSGCEVDVFWREVREGYPHWEFTDASDSRSRGQWGGIGVLARGGDVEQRPSWPA